ncbi:hypothetical protein Droror1_Dr00012879 [Drosera rotundifolia]
MMIQLTPKLSPVVRSIKAPPPSPVIPPPGKSKPSPQSPSRTITAPTLRFSDLPIGLRRRLRLLKKMEMLAAAALKIKGGQLIQRRRGSGYFKVCHRNPKAPTQFGRYSAQSFTRPARSPRGSPKELLAEKPNNAEWMLNPTMSQLHREC